MRFLKLRAFIFWSLYLLGVGSLAAETLFNSEWTNPDGSKSQTTVVFYEDIGFEGKVGYYSGSKRNRFIGKYSSNYTVFEGYWVQDDSSEKCSYTVDGSPYFGRVFFRSNNGKEFEGLWSYCNSIPNLRWQGWRAPANEIIPLPLKPNGNTNIEVQIALNFFGYNAGNPDGLFGAKTKNAIAKLQICWEAVDPYLTMIPATDELGVLSEYQRKVLIRELYAAQSVGLNRSNCSWFQEMMSSSAQLELEATNVTKDGFCNYGDHLVEPVFYCTIQNTKRIKICEAEDENGQWNSLQYSFGIINGKPELELVSEISSVYVPGVVGKTSIEQMRPTCTDPDGAPCETNHTMNYDFNDTYNQFIFLNGNFEYLINASSWLGSKFRAYEGGIVVNKINQALPLYHPNYRRTLTILECDEGSVKNTVWDGLYVDKTINDQGLCWVDMGDESASWQQCLP